MLRRLSNRFLARHTTSADPRPAAATLPQVPSGPSLPWEPVGRGIVHPDPEGREWIVHDTCPVCGYPKVTPICAWNKLLLLRTAPDQTSATYDYGVCRACGILSAMRRPCGSRYRFLLEHFGEVTAKRGEGRDIVNPVLNPYPLTDADREDLRRRVARGVFVSDHLVGSRSEYLPGLASERFEMSGHVDLLGALLSPRKARVLEVRPKAGGLLDGLRRSWDADVFAMPIWESQQFLLKEVYGIPTSDLIDFDRFHIPFEGAFDLIVCQHMLTHAVRPRDFFAELRRCLVPGGHIYLHNEPDDDEYLSGSQSMVAALNPLHLQAFDQGSLMRGLAANGFETVFVARHRRTQICLARLTEPATIVMDVDTRTRRIRRYRKAYYGAILRLDERARSRIAAEWHRVATMAVTRGGAEIDRDGRVRAGQSKLTKGGKQPKI